jgi:hypothetical protein
LRIAATVSEAWPEAKARIVSDFLRQLGDSLTKKRKGWRTGIDNGHFFLDPWPSFEFYKPEWGTDYSLTLQCGRYGEIMLFGVTRDENKVPGLELCSEILEAVRKLYPAAKTAKWWEALISLRSPSPDWRKPEILWRIRTDQDFMDDIENQFIDLANEVEAIIDRAAQKNNSIKTTKKGNN